MTKKTVKLNYLRIAPRKVRSVADLLRGLSVNEAEAQLMLVRNRAAVPLRKLLRSAVQNLQNNKKQNPPKKEEKEKPLKDKAGPEQKTNRMNKPGFFRKIFNRKSI